MEDHGSKMRYRWRGNCSLNKGAFHRMQSAKIEDARAASHSLLF
jgi:hypothetical protein